MVILKKYFGNAQILLPRTFDISIDFFITACFRNLLQISSSSLLLMMGFGSLIGKQKFL
jgi:hypothetical protein